MRSLSGTAFHLVLLLSTVNTFAQTDSLGPVREPEPVEKPEPVVERDPVVEEVIVTGTKQGLGIQKTTESVEVFSAQRLEDEVVFTVGEALSRAANTSLIGDNLNSINIRGVNRNGTGGAGQGQAINIYIDGAPASAAALSGLQSIWDLQQVEVLRGSQSTVQGRNAIAGAVILKSSSPSYDWEGAARIRGAQYGTRQYAGVISGPIIENELAFRLSTDYQDFDGYVTDVFRDKTVDFRENLATRGKLLWEPSALPALSTQLTLEYSDRTTGTDPFVLAPGAGNEPSFQGFDPDDRESFPRFRTTTDYKTTRVIFDLSYDFSDAVSLQLLGTYEDVDQEGRSEDRFVSSFAELGVLGFTDEQTATAEARLEFDFGAWTGLVGAYYFESTRAFETFSTLLLSAAFPFPVEPGDSAALANSTQDTETENYAFFTSWRFEPSDRWAFDLGLRYDVEEFVTQQELVSAETLPDECMGTIPGELLDLPIPEVTLPCAVGAGLLFPPPEPLQSDNFDALLPRGAVTYFFNNDVSVFASLRRGYRAGGTALSTSAFGSQFQVVTFDPEFLVGYEAGLRSQWMDGRLTLNATAFYSDYEDQQVTVLDELGFSITLNAGQTTLYGLELSGDYQASDTLSFFYTVGLLETNIDDFPLNEFADPPINLSGNSLDRSPALSFTVGVNYEHFNGFFAGASFNYTSSAESDIFNLGPEELGGGLTERVGSASLLNAQIGILRDGYRLALFGTNLLNEDEPESANFAASGVLTDPDLFALQASYNIRQPRTLGISLDWVY
ncbi:MAG: TonB-dependent receptor [Pseudomonadota bacterium]